MLKIYFYIREFFMGTSFQNEIPKARVNITLDLVTNGSQKKTELPLKLLVMGKFNAHGDQSNIAAREKISVNKNNLNKVMKDLSPSVEMAVPHCLKKNEKELKVALKFQSITDFHPQNLVNQVPELKRLLAMRNLLKELKANVVDNKTLKTELEKIVRDKSVMARIQNELQAIQQRNDPHE